LAVPYADDLRTLVEGLKFAKSLEETEIFKRNGIKMFDDDTMICGKFEAFSDEYYECRVKNYLQTVFHPASTCTMGPNEKEI
jgi:hypothetical protein